jgi:hypothetical protein
MEIIYARPRIFLACVLLLVLNIVAGFDDFTSSIHDTHMLEDIRSRRLDADIYANGGAGLVSPSDGTDISSPIPLLKCNNQTRCIKPYLQLQHRFKVYFCKHVGHGVRFYFLTREGLLQHPLVDLVDNMEYADVIVYLPESAPWHKTECTKPEYFHKTIVLDESDGANMFEPSTTGEATKWLLYFKRSFVRRGDGQFQGYMNYLQRNDVLPMSYTIADQYVRPQFSFHRDRTLDIVSTLRGGSHDPCRLRVREWTKEYCEERKKNCVVGQVNSASRRTVDMTYMNNMYNAKVIVSVNPSRWEGDFRLMEAIATGALVFVDIMHVHRPYPLLHGKHVVYYDNKNRTDLFEKLDHYMSTVEHARRVAVQGYVHCMKYHRAASLTDYIFRTVHLKLSKLKQKGAAIGKLDNVPPPQPPYTHTAFHIRNLCKDPGAKERLKHNPHPREINHII